MASPWWAMDVEEEGRVIMISRKGEQRASSRSQCGKLVQITPVLASYEEHTSHA